MGHVCSGIIKNEMLMKTACPCHQSSLVSTAAEAFWCLSLNCCRHIRGLSAASGFKVPQRLNWFRFCSVSVSVCMYVCVSCPGDQLRANRQSSCELIQSKHCSLGKSSRPYGYRSCSHMTVSRHCTKTHVQQEHMLLQDLVSALHTVRERGTRVGNCLLWYLNSEVLISADKQRHVTEQASML